MLTGILVLVCGHNLAAQESAPPASVAPGTALSRVHVDRPGDGNVWVLAPGYKARFGLDGVDYMPYFGAEAPRHFKVAFRLQAVRRGSCDVAFAADVQPVVDGERVTFHRGAVREVWDLRRHEVEQSFVFDDLTGNGDLCVQLDVQTELAASDVAGGLSFAHPTLGHVHYGDVVTFDDGGQRVVTASQLTPHGIELRVPATFLRQTHGSLTVDPVVRTIAVDSGADHAIAGEVAFEPTTGNWLVVYTRDFSTTDSDIITRRFNTAGDFLEEVAVATGSRESRRPSVGANGPARQFLVAWDEDTSVADRVILGRTRDAASTAQGSIITVHDTSGLGNDDFAPKVGGSIATDASGANYAVVCRSDNSNGLHASFVRVTTGGSATRINTLSTGLEDVAGLAINKARRTNSGWLCTYLVRSGSLLHVHAATAPATGTAVFRVVVDNINDCTLGGVAGDGRDFLAVHSRVIATGNSDIIGAQLRAVGSTFSVLGLTNLTIIEPGATAAVDQIAPTVAFDGCRYTYAYQEAAGAAGNFDLFAAVVSFPGAVFNDGHRALHTASTDVERDPSMASSGDMGGEAGRSFVLFTRVEGNDIDVAGVLFDGISPGGGVVSLPTDCGNLQLVAQNQPMLGSTLRLRVSRIRVGTEVFLVGLPISPRALCSAGCALGVSPILFTALGIDLDLPIACGATLVGAQVAVQNVLVGGTGGCVPPATPFALVTSNTLVITVR